jgi:hypothetical protein
MEVAPTTIKPREILSVPRASVPIKILILVLERGLRGREPAYLASLRH